MRNFYVNDSELKTANFNGAKVNSIYYNDTLVWEGYEWVGWGAATWKDIYDLCKAKQNGYITEYPSDVKWGKTKELHLNAPENRDVTMTLIGIDIDGPGVLTFSCLYPTDPALNPDCEVFNNEANGADNLWADSAIRINCMFFHKYCEAKDYIKPLMKGTQVSKTATDVDYTEETVWTLSLAEIVGNDPTYKGRYNGLEFTKGVHTSYFPVDSTNYWMKHLNVKKPGVWTRSSDFLMASTNTFIIKTDVTPSTVSTVKPTTQGVARYVHCFAIG